MAGGDLQEVLRRMKLPRRRIPKTPILGPFRYIIIVIFAFMIVILFLLVRMGEYLR